jgi:co-chaperonin GroES (HSP10)
MKMLNKAVVVAIGPGKMAVHEGKVFYIPVGIKVGDTVFVNQHAGLKVSLGDSAKDEYLIFKEDEILGVWPAPEAVTAAPVAAPTESEVTTT